MASPTSTNGTKYEIVSRRDGICILCRGRTLKGGRVWWNQKDGTVHHVECPPVVDLTASTYTAPPVSPDRWKDFCKQIIEAMSGENTIREVIEDDRIAYEREGPCGMIRSIVHRTRCTGGEAIEIARKWIDTLKEPVDEEKFQKLNQTIRESNRKVMVAGPG